jgi:RNA polymerase sigma-70 factor (ECF subfamily)
MKMKRTADIRKIIDTDDTVLIQRVLDGHTEQFRPLADRHAHRVQKFVARMIPLSEDAEEVTQDTLVSAFQSLARFDAERASFRTWLLRIAYHIALKRLRQTSRKGWIKVEENDIEDFPDQETETLLNDTTTERLTRLKQAIGQLAPDDQMLLSLYYHDGLPLREIAYIVDSNDSYLRSRLQWLRKKIHQTIINLEHNESKHN